MTNDNEMYRKFEHFITDVAIHYGLPINDMDWVQTHDEEGLTTIEVTVPIQQTLIEIIKDMEDRIDDHYNFAVVIRGDTVVFYDGFDYDNKSMPLGHPPSR